jgi:high affinity Mn2+ porin
MSVSAAFVRPESSIAFFKRTAKPVLVFLWCSLCLSHHAQADGAAVDDPAAAVSVSPDESGAAAGPSTPETWNLHGQMTHVVQGYPAFRAPYSGQNSLDPAHRNAETTDTTLFAGFRPWKGGELYINPEEDQGFGLSNTLGVAGYPSGEAYKVGAHAPYLRIPRLFIRQVFGLGGSDQAIEDGANQLDGSLPSDNITLTVGKFSAVDIFDTNTYAHDPRADFFNWSVIESGAYDYAADAWGFTYGAAAEWTQSWWTLRGGLFDLSRVPNTTTLDPRFSQYEIVTELEERHQLSDHPGKVKLLLYVNRGRMGSYADALTLAQQTQSTPDTALVRHYASHPGLAVNAEQEISSDLGVFARASANGGNMEAFDFTEINRSLSTGLSLKGNRWGRADDTVGMAVVENGLSAPARAYFAAGGMGILIGDGQLNYHPEKIAELYYSWRANKHATLTFDCQYVANPAYNADRGPVNFYALRLHMEY